MLCRELSRKLLERELGLRADGGTLERHLAGCPTCAARAGFEHSLSAALAALRDAPVPPVDVRGRIATQIAALGAAAPGEGFPRALGWATAGAVAFAAVLIAGLPWIAPQATLLARETWSLLPGLRSLLAALAESTAPLLAASGRIALHLASALGPLLRAAEPLGSAVVFAAAAVMGTSIALIVVRDFHLARRVCEDTTP